MFLAQGSVQFFYIKLNVLHICTSLVQVVQVIPLHTNSSLSHLICNIALLMQRIQKSLLKPKAIANYKQL